MEVYQQTMPLYFPRSTSEELWAISKLPQDLGSEDGEPVIEERKIPILDRPMPIPAAGKAWDLICARENKISLGTCVCPCEAHIMHGRRAFFFSLFFKHTLLWKGRTGVTGKEGK